MRLWKELILALRAQGQYFSRGRYEIARDNLATLQIAGAAGGTMALLFFAVTPLIMPGWQVTAEYWFVVPILLGAFLFAFFYHRRTASPDPRVVELASALFYILLLADFIALSVFPYPDTPQIFISLCFMFMPVLLNQRPAVLLGVMLTAEAVFVVLAARYKTAFSLQNDLFNTAAAILFSLVIMVITNRLRCRDYSVRMKLEQLSETDALTGLMNKNAFEECSAAYLRGPEAAGGCTLLVLDLDEFKQVNDLYGHPVGDAMLTAMGQILRSTFRQSDLVGRIGGDEFAVLLRGVGSTAVPESKCAALRARLDELVVEGVALHGSCSVGGAAYPGARPISYADLFRTADEALYGVKRTGKGQACILPLE